MAWLAALVVTWLIACQPGWGLGGLLGGLAGGLVAWLMAGDGRPGWGLGGAACSEQGLDVCSPQADVCLCDLIWSHLTAVR